MPVRVLVSLHSVAVLLVSSVSAAGIVSMCRMMVATQLRVGPIAQVCVLSHKMSLTGHASQTATVVKESGVERFAAGRRFVCRIVVKVTVVVVLVVRGTWSDVIPQPITARLPKRDRLSVPRVFVRLIV